mgnify:CR=1 FL=1
MPERAHHGIDWSKVITDRPPPVRRVRPEERRPGDSPTMVPVERDHVPEPIEVFDLLGAPELPPPETDYALHRRAS